MRPWQDYKMERFALLSSRRVTIFTCANVQNAGRSLVPAIWYALTAGGERRTLALLDILPRLAAARGATVEFVNGEAAQKLTAVGGMGGWLRQATRTAAG